MPFSALSPAYGRDDAMMKAHYFDDAWRSDARRNIPHAARHAGAALMTPASMFILTAPEAPGPPRHYAFRGDICLMFRFHRATTTESFCYEDEPAPRDYDMP